MAQRVEAPPLYAFPISVLGRVRRRLAAIVLAPLYRIYTDRLRHEVRAQTVPHHVAVILDGNRRWASEAGLKDLSAGHRHGADKIDDLVEWCSDLGIAEVTLWALSGENLGRESGEVDALLRVVAEKLDGLAERAARAERPIRIRVFGRFGAFPEALRGAIERAEQQTRQNAGLRLNIALGYSGRDELVDACRAMVRSLAETGVPAEDIAGHVTREALAAHLYTAGRPDPDLIIRTSGELRLSGFLPWQSAHSEFYFTDVFWPAFRELDFLRALRTYQQRERRFGR
jgi:short-chain Z-isoprenyl diphosphate synthase